MSRAVELLCSRRVPHVAVLALVSVGFAGCSADMSTRFSQNSFSNPFASQRETTGAVPAPAVERRELPQYSRQPLRNPMAAPPSVLAPQTYPTAVGVAGGGRGLASYAPPTHPIETTGTIAPRSIAAARTPNQAGATIIVGTSDTLDGLAARYHVSPAAILQANGYRGPRALSPGQQLIIPRQTATAPAPTPATPATRPIAAVAATSVHFVNRGDTLLSVARRNHLSVSELARANGLDPQAKLRLGSKLTVPALKTTAATPALQPEPVAIAQPPAPPAPATRMAAAGIGPQH